MRRRRGEVLQGCPRHLRRGRVGTLHIAKGYILQVRGHLEHPESCLRRRYLRCRLHLLSGISIL